MTIVLKIKLNDDTRRVTLEKVPNYQDLNELFIQLFPVLQSRPFHIKYLDDDQDMVTVTSDLELKEAISVALKQSPSSPVLRLFLFEKESTSPSFTAAPKSGKQEEIPSQQQQQQQQQQPPLVGLLNQLLQNPQGIANQFLQNPQGLANQFLQQAASATGTNGQPNIADLVGMFQNLGLNPPTPSTSENPQQQLQQWIQGLLANPFVQQQLPQLMSFFNNFAQRAQESCSEWNPNSNANADSEPVVHAGVVCDACQNGIVGIRYKCSNCSDYDLCEGCEKKAASVHDPTHVFLKILRPQGSGGRGCPYMRPHGWGHRMGRCGGGQHQGKHLARFVADVTYEDGTVVPANQPFVKIWRVRNEGNTAWPENTHLGFVGGDKLSNVESVAVAPISASEELDIAVDMVAPPKPGRYVSYWRLVQPDGSKFGQRVWVDIIVPADKEEETQTAVPVSSTQTTQTMEVEKSTQSTQTAVATPTPTPQVTTQVAPTQQMQVEQPKPQESVSPQMQQLLDMGFSDKARNDALLQKHNGNVLAVVQELLK